jgi:hypothetical protein
MAHGAKSGGRQAGTPNKLTGTAKENIAAVFTRLGGTSAMAEWAKDNKDEFYKIYARLIPTEVTGKDGGPIQVDAPWLSGRSL